MLETLIAQGQRAAQEGRLEDACALWRQALGLQPDNIGVRAALSDLLFRRGDPAGAAAELERQARRLAKNLTGVREPYAYRMLGGVLLGQGSAQEALALYAEARAHLPQDLDLESAELFALTCSEVPDEALFARHATFGARLEQAHPARFQFAGARDPERPLRVGYVSGDFAYHVITLFTLPVLEHHELEVFCYSTSGRSDDYTRQVAAAADHWRPAAALSDTQLADAIHADGIDILVDLGGHSGLPQLRVFAQRPAPVQATWIGYLGTTGMSRMDYRITDATADPPGLTERLHTETLARLPHSQWCYRPFTQKEVGGKSGSSVTFGSFNQAFKLTSATRRLWAALLARMPEARLVVLGIPPGAQEDLRRELGAGERVHVLPYVSLEDYFRWLQQVDIALDTLPYSGGTTTCDALWMGVPVLTLPGTRSASRSAASILTTAGLTEWIASSPEDYVDRAARLSREKISRNSIREKMRASPLMDEAGFTRDLEKAYRQMWRRYCSQGT